MALRPPRTGAGGSAGKAGFSVSRKLSERARAAQQQTAQPPAGQPPPGQAASAPAGGLGAVVTALQGLVEQLSEAARSQPSDRHDHDHDPVDGRHGEQGTPPPGAASFVRSFDLGGKQGARMVFGYTLRMGLDGVSAEPFGDVPDKAAASPAAPVARQPIVELFEEPGLIVVVAELPGADPASLICRMDGAALLIEAGGTRRYRKRVDLPAAVQAADIRHSFQNGILEVRLKRADAA